MTIIFTAVSTSTCEGFEIKASTPEPPPSSDHETEFTHPSTAVTVTIKDKT